MTPERIIDDCRKAHRKLIFAESLTGGLLVDAFVTIPGASDVVLGSEVTYSNELKVALLGVDENLLATQGAVSAEVARQMVKSAHAIGQTVAGVTGSQVLAASTTGNAGPSGDPVGQVFIAVTDGIKTKVQEFLFNGDRHEIRTQTVAEAIRLISEFSGNSKEV